VVKYPAVEAGEIQVIMLTKSLFSKV